MISILTLIIETNKIKYYEEYYQVISSGQSYQRHAYYVHMDTFVVSETMLNVTNVRIGCRLLYIHTLAMRANSDLIEGLMIGGRDNYEIDTLFYREINDNMKLIIGDDIDDSGHHSDYPSFISY